MKRQHIKGRNTIDSTKKRIIVISVSMLMFMSMLMLNLFKLQVLSYSYYKDKVYDQITTTSPLKAERGQIYDRNMQLLATTSTSWRIFISTKDIKNAEAESSVNYTEIISKGLANILNINQVTIVDKIKNTKVLDMTIEKNATESEYEKVLQFIKDNNLERLVFTEAQSTRYYPEETLAAHALGFCGSDNQGLYGIEYFYNDLLSGTDGYYLYAKDATGNALDTEYSTYYPAVDGLNLVTTIDTYLQKKLETQLETILNNHNVQNRVCGIVMDTTTGAILAMATSSPFDPNNPYVLDSLSMEKLAQSGYAKDSEEYKKLKIELLQKMWSNKAVSETYEPGSTFKIVTVATALDLGVATPEDKFSCPGYYTVGGWRIKCHKTTGHGSNFTLSYGLQMSCNPTMMQIAERIGSQNFYNYVEKFGYFGKSGIDLPSEAGTIFHSPDKIGPTELATASFGQRFKVSIINHLTAIAAVANGGKLVTPYMVEKVLDNDGNTVIEHSVEVKNQVISEDVARIVSEILEEGVSGDGGAKNAAVAGYKVAAKTGTSQKFDILDENGNSYLRIGSTVAYAPSDDSGIAVIIVVDEPSTTVKYGSVVAAPYVSAFLSDALPYLGYISEQEHEEIPIPDLVGKTTDEAKKILKELKINFSIIGDGDIILSQTPSIIDSVALPNTTVILYTVETVENIIIPSLVGKSIAEATQICINLGLNIKITGSGAGTVVSQSLPLGAIVRKGDIIELHTLILDYED